MSRLPQRSMAGNHKNDTMNNETFTLGTKGHRAVTHVHASCLIHDFIMSSSSYLWTSVRFVCGKIERFTELNMSKNAIFNSTESVVPKYLISAFLTHTSLSSQNRVPTISLLVCTLFYHSDSLQNANHTAHDLTRLQFHSVTTSFMTS